MELFVDNLANYWLDEIRLNVFEDHDPPSPPLRYQPSRRFIYFGYPCACARVVARFKNIKRGVVIEETVSGTKNKDYRLMKADVISKIYTIYCQLEALKVIWNKEYNNINIEFPCGEVAVLQLFVCDDSGLFYIMTEGGPKTTNLIYYLRILLKDPYTNFNMFL